MEEYFEDEEEKEIRPCACNIKQLAGFYKVTARTMKRWLRRIAWYVGAKDGQYNIIQCKRIFKKLGTPFRTIKIIKTRIV